MAKRDESRNLTHSAERGKATIIPPSFHLNIRVSMRTRKLGCITTGSGIMIRGLVIISAKTL
jgi:hypothetical protein